jgi:hypothetical protein
MIGDSFPHKLAGRAAVDLRTVAFSAGRILQADGQFAAGPGVISRSLLLAAVDSNLAVETEELESVAERLITYDELAFEFAIDDEGLTVTGSCDEPLAGSMLTKDGTALLTQPEKQPVPVVALVHALVPQNTVQVPMTRETELLLRVLPLPSLCPPDGRREPYTPVRFAGDMADDAGSPVN